jgi:hypothetical protein
MPSNKGNPSDDRWAFISIAKFPPTIFSSGKSIEVIRLSLKSVILPSTSVNDAKINSVRELECDTMKSPRTNCSEGMLRNVSEGLRSTLRVPPIIDKTGNASCCSKTLLPMVIFELATVN